MARRFLATWGNADFGRLGHGLPCLGQDVPRAVSALSDCAPIAVACGGAHTAAIGEDGSLYTMGLNDAGQLGHSHASNSVADPMEVLLPEATIAVAAGNRHTLLLAESGDVWAMGSNADGQLGLGGAAPASTPMPRRIPALAGAKVVHIAAGAQHSMAVTAQGELLTWGSGLRGKLGHGRAAVPVDRDERTPRLLLSLRDVTVVHASAGLLHSGCVDGAGNSYMWGCNQFWQLGLPTVNQVSDPTQVDVRSVTQLALSGMHSMALRHSGQLLAWGANEHGVLGFRDGRLSARQPTVVPKCTFEQIVCGWKHCAGVDGNGRLHTWGWGGSMGSKSTFVPSETSSGGQLGLGNDFDYWTPAKVEQLLQGDQSFSASGREGSAWRVQQVACGFNHSAAIVELL